MQDWIRIRKVEVLSRLVDAEEDTYDFGGATEAGRPRAGKPMTAAMAARCCSITPAPHHPADSPVPLPRLRQRPSRAADRGLRRLLDTADPESCIEGRPRRRPATASTGRSRCSNHS